ncbi:MAG: beta-lactamase family protein [Salinivirgaceae bacterium]|nr:beta-lactamase family protein [Salinivirgaceae bacterium]
MNSDNIKQFLPMVVAAGAMVVVCHIGSRCGEIPAVDDTVIEAPQKPNRCTFTKEQIAAIDSVVERKCRSGNFSGVVLIGQKDSVLYERACGYANIKECLPNTDTTTFQLASVSKQFTAVAILQLYERGKLRLTDSVAKYLPGFPYPDITIHQLLIHRSGLPNYHYLCDRKKMLDDPYFSNQQIVAELIEANAGRYFLPNRRFQYSNTGYAVLAAVVEAVSGLKFEVYLQRNIFEPLQMSHTFTYRAMQSVTYPPRATGYVRRRTPADDNYLDHFLGDKGIYSTANDLMKWDQGLYSGKIINADTLQLAFQPMGRRIRFGTNYGYGWRITTYADTIPIQFHSGWWHGFKTMLVRVPQDTATIVVLRNSSSRTGGIGMGQILDILYSSAQTDTTLFDTGHIDAEEFAEADSTLDLEADSVEIAIE